MAATGILLAIALCAMRTTAQSTTTISMFLNLVDTHPTPIITASIVHADPTATTFVANCDYTDDSEVCAMTDQTVTAGPSFQDFTSTGAGDAFYRLSCTFTGTTDGACAFTQSGAGSVYSDTLAFDSATNPFPGFAQVLVTAGVEELGAQSSATEASGTSRTASSSGPEETGSSATTTSSDGSQTNTSASASGQATGGAGGVLPYTRGGLLALLVIPGMLCM